MNSSRILIFHAGFKRKCNPSFRLTGTRHFTVLAIESSADDTCCAIVDSTRKIYSNIVMKQNDIHEPYGGIYPMSAIGTHQQNMPCAVQRALDDSKLDLLRDIDGIAFTRGPGMPGCLSVGMNAAKTLAAALRKPLVGVHHMQAHALTPLLTAWPNQPTFPFLTQLVSGGHTLLLLATSVNSFRILATTRDESIGRSFDKVSKLLELNWTNLGPGDALEKFCAEDSGVDCPSIPAFPRPLLGKLAYSFAALHSHVKQFIEVQGGIANLTLSMKRALARGFQIAAVQHLEEKLLLGLNYCKTENIPVRSVVVSGGVASNTFLRERFQACLLDFDSNTSLSLTFPPPSLCTDNAVMIGWTSIYRFLAQDTDNYDIGLRPKWCIEDL
ncbi:hypothetical protein M413DRAFT_66070 [Hebeloma cylindrosporum]|uniref:N(6)-L-threonylcarbamoyladenine synthase n=1 Tax=Hebeloma cylindrosporum TaxID=76867 RepID=A0A0C3CM38_HEBCY|nr:hypothetical protein M413DRAFT_66070 [Hebeloma cylindrosporum h7]